MKMDQNKQDYFDEKKNRAEPPLGLVLLPYGLVFWFLVALVLVLA